MKKVSLVLLFCCLAAIHAHAQDLASLEAKRIGLPNGWSLTPVGRSLPLGDLPLNMAISPSQKLLAVTNNGQSKHSLQLIDVVTEKVLDHIEVPKAWVGLEFSADNRFLYVSGGNDNRILKYAVKNQQLLLADSILLGKAWPEKISPTGLSIDHSKQLLYVVTKDNNRLYVIDLVTKQIKKELALPGEAYTCRLSPDKKELYISCWGCSRILVYGVTEHRILSEIAVGSNPNDLCMTANGRWLYVANANDNSVSVIDTKQRKVVETLNAALYPDAPTGSTTNGVAMSADEKTLYIANADNNCLSVYDVSRKGSSVSKGFIPVGWYPTAVKTIGSKIYVTNGKGFTSQANPFGPNPISKKIQLGFQKGDTSKPKEVQYIGGLFKGTLSILPVPSAKQLSVYSQAVYRNSPYSKNRELVSHDAVGNPIPRKVGDPSPIKYVFYIIKENRTYDQVLGDMPEGNGDSSLCLFGRKVTPNQHALAKEFVLLDNFYVDGEVSADGHNWSMGAYATDYLEKTWVTSYGGRGGNYDAEGNRAIANNKNGFIWDHCKRAGVSYRTYGEFADDYKPNIPVLKDHFCPYYTSWDESVRDTTRVGQWKRDFDSLLANNALPRLSTLRLINDHTEGLRLGKPTPFAHVADNDLSVGMFVEYLSKSPIWKESVVFILEDDAQDGPDHVDAHRSTAYVAGGMVKRGFVDHTMYSTSSMLRTIELILGIPPMSQYDAAATPMWRCFTNEVNLTPFTARPAGVGLNEKNTGMNEWQRKSEAFDFSKEDRIPDRAFTEVIWKAVKGLDAVVPAPKRAAFVKLNKKDAD
ncbi:MAG: bifunctional YncE family protein/alkaline phosphatase family protein [Chitinophagaceae bacterium]|nr:bifunctional YncE family protein/alkaline phosphatase family protein [Chitinophagaceae bacterium]MCA6454255.1 bifunctional YncE family protein/alkaline phosphatase family protein [Chitinophagaceae bacterium]MCA6455513.1 bifunctional YncE family protein/alkaline phosphatase family protein [Chitinophagaceae bacterium]MCA6460691.1 bifunctional YncE family protein/alkaline phosphatase family protein [Chitinophagaceae bacterium]MCA6464909.1 bifunctional YncE family protein/alkaline phosphatase fa